jgi:porphobilinogen deaminase
VAPETEGPASLAWLLSGQVSHLLCVAEDVPDPLPSGVTMAAVGIGDRREVLVGGVEALANLAEGACVAVATPRQRALLLAHHPGLEPVDPGTPGALAIRPLWTDSTLEGQGELLEWESWVPAPGQGIPVLLHTGPGSSSLISQEAQDVLTAERGLARAFPGSLTCARGQTFGDGIRLRALLLSPDGRQAVRGEEQGSRDRIEEVVARLAATLRARGADRIPGFLPS